MMHIDHVIGIVFDDLHLRTVIVVKMTLVFRLSQLDHGTLVGNL